MKLSDSTRLPAILRQRSSALFLAISLSLALVIACGPGSGPEPAVPSENAADTNAAPVPSNAGEQMEAAATPVENPTNPPASPQEGQPLATAAPEPPAQAAPTVVAESEPPPAPTSPVRELAALVEANPPVETPEPAPESVSQPEPTAEPERQIAEGPLAAEPTGIYAWINTEPLTLEQLKGKVVLVDFWTYTCVNCIRTFPYLKLWHSRYADDGLVILGIHTPEFDFEKNYWNVLEYTQQNGILWPVAQDNEYETWQAYNNRYWPAKYLIDQDGVIRYTHFGEGKYAETEEEIRKLLAEAGADLSDDLDLPQDQELDSSYLGALDAEVTPELYAGYERNVNSLFTGFNPYVIQETFYENLGKVANFVAPENPLPHLIFFHGLWEVGAERARHARVSNGYQDYLTLKYSAKSVNAVLTSDSGKPYRVRVTLDGQYLTEENRGSDIQLGEDGESYLLVDQPRLYEIVNSPTYQQRRDLRLSSNSPDFGLFAFTFGVYQGAGP